MSHSNDAGIMRIALNLTAACAVSGVIIAATYTLTKDQAERSEAEMKAASMRSLVPEASSFKPLEGQKDCYVALKDDTALATIIPSESKGYGGSIKMLVAVLPDAKVLSFTILSANETPGLGDKANTPLFQAQFKGKDIAHLKVVKDPANKDDIQALTGATITSKAVTLAVKEAVERYDAMKEGK
jgi:Na+-translocating ferredoxin:NAD+ oxidoreductase subunit G